MTHRRLDGKKIAILIDNDFEEVEMTKPRDSFNEAGAETFIVSPQQSTVRARNLSLSPGNARERL
jgi:protease I